MPRRYFSTFQLLLLGIVAALIVAANLALRLPLKLPGHSGVVWMALLITARRIVPKPGAAVVGGLLSGVLAAFGGLGDHGPLDAFLSYAAAGLGVDLVLSAAHGGGMAACALAGLAGNLAKHAVKLLLGLWIGIPTGFAVAGWSFPLLTHSAFGLAGGVLGWLVLEALRRSGFFAYLAEKR